MRRRGIEIDEKMSTFRVYYSMGLYGIRKIKGIRAVMTKTFPCSMSRYQMLVIPCLRPLPSSHLTSPHPDDLHRPS